MRKIATIPSYQFEDTTHPNVKRFVDRDGEWTHYWLVKEKRFVKGVTHILGMGFPKGPRFYEYLLSVSKEEARKKLVAAGDEGSRTHQAIRQLIGGSKVTMTTKFPSELRGGRQEPLNAEEWDNLIAFEAFCKRYAPRTVAHEFTVYSKHNTGYAGTADYFCVLTVPSGDKAFPKEVWGKDILVLIDWKSSGAIYNEYPAQLAAYAAAIGEMDLFPKFRKAFAGRIYTMVVRLGTRHKNGGYELGIYDLTESLQHQQTFESARLLADSIEPTFAPEIEQIPTQFFIKMAKAKAIKPKAIKKQKLTVVQKKIIKKAVGPVRSKKGAGKSGEQGQLPLK